jgi:acylphosphatase
VRGAVKRKWTGGPEEAQAMERLRVRARVRGLVQGVGFRAATQREASRLGLVGWVRNLPDGRVELEAEGLDARVGELIAWCSRGPAGADVEHVDSEAVAVKPEEHGFRIAR